MQNHYAEQLIELLRQRRPELDSRCRLEFKNAFGAVGGYIEGRIFVVCGRFGLALKLPPDIRDALFKNKVAARFRYFPNGHIKKEYALLAQLVLDDRRQLNELIDASIAYALASKDAKR